MNQDKNDSSKKRMDGALVEPFIVKNAEQMYNLTHQNDNCVDVIIECYELLNN